MRTKEIDVWVNREDYLNAMNFVVFIDKRDDTHKAKLIIEIPEQKIEITESEFDSALEDNDMCPRRCAEFKKQLGFTNE